MVMLYQIQHGFFDSTIKKSLNDDPLEKYVQKVQRQLQNELQNQRFFEVRRPEDDLTSEKGTPKDFSVREELKRKR
jgi:hypothetical protein